MLNHVRTARRARQVVATTTVRVRAGGRVPTARKSALARIMGRGYRVVATTNAHARVVGAAPTAPTLQLAATITLARIMGHAHRVVATTVVPARISWILLGPTQLHQSNMLLQMPRWRLQLLWPLHTHLVLLHPNFAQQLRRRGRMQYKLLMRGPGKCRGSAAADGNAATLGSVAMWAATASNGSSSRSSSRGADTGVPLLYSTV